MKPDCERFEIEIGMRQHGALDVREEAELTAHLATCDSCRRFAAASGDLSSNLQRQAEREAESVDWDRLGRNVQRLRRSHRRKLWLAPLFLLQTPVAFLAATGHLPDRQVLAIAPVATVAIYLAFVWFVNRPFRALMAAGKSGSDLLAGYARELLWQRMRARIFLGVNLALALACAVGVVFEAEPRVRLYEIGCVLLFAGWAAYDFAWKLPRLRRALLEAGR